MFSKVTAAHLTGSNEVVDNFLLTDETKPRDHCRTLSQMFFQPYESKKEFIFCARHTVLPAISLSLGILSPMSLMLTPIILLGIAAGAYALSCLLDPGNDKEFFLEAAEFIFTQVCQSIVDLILLPLSVLVMATRGVSTGLQAADIYDYDASPEEVVYTPV